MSKDKVELDDRLRAFMEIIIEEVRTNPRLAQRLRHVLGETTDETYGRKTTSRPHRRTPPTVDPFTLFEQGEDHLRQALGGLNLDQLKDVVAGYGMDRARLALRWKKPDRLVNLIVETVKIRSQKGEVFKD